MTTTPDDNKDSLLLPHDANGRPIARPLVDDLVNVLSMTVISWSPVVGQDLAQASEVRRVLARYRIESKREAQEKRVLLNAYADLISRMIATSGTLRQSTYEIEAQALWERWHSHP